MTMNGSENHHDSEGPAALFDLERFWDERRWQPSAVLGAARAWATATALRRRTVIVIAVVVGLFVIPGILGAVAQADPGGDTLVSNSALSWMYIRDSEGVDLSNYDLATDISHSIFDFDPKGAGIVVILSFEFSGWMMVVGGGIWLIGYVVSFRWLDIVVIPLRTVSHSLTGTIATPLMLITAVTVGGGCVAWFVLRAQTAKAAVQVVTMVGVAVIGPMFLADPLASVLSSDGFLSRGRDVGLTVAAGLNGDRYTPPAQLITNMQTHMADNFARHPLQVWNFGHVIDDNPVCRDAWTNAGLTHNQGAMRSALKSCDYAAWNSIEHPSVGQLGTGLLLLLCAILLLGFAVALSLRIVRSALDSVYHGLLAIFGFAAGGFIYGPSQTFLVRNIMDGFFAGFRMCVEIIFLGIYTLILGDIFTLVHGHVMEAFCIASMLEVVAISQLRRLSTSIDRGSDWVANRFARRLQADGGNGGRALGMGDISARWHMPGLMKLLNSSQLFVGGELVPLAMLGRLGRGIDHGLGFGGGGAAPTAAPAAGRGPAAGGGGPAGGGPAAGGGGPAAGGGGPAGGGPAAGGGGPAGGGPAAAPPGPAAGRRAVVPRGAGGGLPPASRAPWNLRPLRRAALPPVLGARHPEVLVAPPGGWEIGSFIGPAGFGVLPPGSGVRPIAAAMSNVQGLAAQAFATGQQADMDNFAAGLTQLHQMSAAFRHANIRGQTLGPEARQWLNQYMAHPSRENLEALGHLAHTPDTSVLPKEIRDRVNDLRSQGLDRHLAESAWAGIGYLHADSVHQAISKFHGQDLTDPRTLEAFNTTMQAIDRAQLIEDRWVPTGMPSVFG
ncbi:hypothetical protein [Nocardia heshunensis]